jgi:hypothetical protein
MISRASFLDVWTPSNSSIRAAFDSYTCGRGYGDEAIHKIYETPSPDVSVTGLQEQRIE